MFGREKTEKLYTELDALRTEKKQLKEQIEELKFKKRLEQEEIIHLQKINEQKLKAEVEAEKLAIQKKYQEDITGFKKHQTEQLLVLHKELHEKLESRFNTELGNLKEIYQALMARLPNVNLTLTKRV